jgi:hypothetical protein
MLYYIIFILYILLYYIYTSALLQLCPVIFLVSALYTYVRTFQVAILISFVRVILRPFSIVLSFLSVLVSELSIFYEIR